MVHLKLTISGPCEQESKQTSFYNMCSFNVLGLVWSMVAGVHVSRTFRLDSYLAGIDNFFTKKKKKKKN